MEEMAQLLRKIELKCDRMGVCGVKDLGTARFLKKYWQLLLGVAIGILAAVLFGYYKEPESILVNGTSKEFRPPELVRIEPHGNMSVSLEPKILLEFSAPVVEDTRVGKFFTSDAIRFQPEIPGECVWETSSTLRFVPSAPLQPSTHYSGTVDISRLVPLPAASKVREAAVDFATTRFAVEKTLLTIGEDKYGQPPEANLELIFNYPVHPAELADKLVVRYESDQRPLTYEILNTAPTSRIRVVTEPVTRWGQADSIELVLPSELTCIEGQMGLANEYKNWFPLEKYSEAGQTLEVYSVLPAGWMERPTIQIDLSDDVAVDIAKHNIRLSPAVDFVIQKQWGSLLLTGENLKPRGMYEVTIDGNLTSTTGRVLGEDFRTVVVMPDLEPSICFSHPGVYLPKANSGFVQVETVNVEEIEVTAYRIFANNVVPFLTGRDLDSGILSKAGQLLQAKKIATVGQPNEKVITTLDMTELVPEDTRIAAVVVRDRYHPWRQDRKLIIHSNLGIVGKVSGNDVLVWVNALDTLRPESGARVSVFSTNNQEIVHGLTDSDGVVHFKNLTSVLSDFTPSVIVAETDRDFSFMVLDTAKVNLTDFDVVGRDVLLRGYEAFLYLDRELFRPGDTGHLTAIIRGVQTSVPPSFPVTLRVFDPKGEVFCEILGSSGDKGYAEFELSFPTYAKTGEYRAELYVAEKRIGAQEFRLEEFMPERIKVTTTPDRKMYGGGEVAHIQVNGQTLYGPAAAGRRAQMRVHLEPMELAVPGYLGYCFADPSRLMPPYLEELTEQRLDDGGNAVFSYAFPRNMRPAAMVKALFETTVIEEGGRPVNDYSSVQVSPYKTYVGARSTLSSYGTVGEPVRFKYVVVDERLEVKDEAPVRIKVFSVTWNTVYRLGHDGLYRYETEREENLIFETEAMFSRIQDEFAYTPTVPGSYRIVFSDGTVGEEEAHRASLEFDVWGWGYSPWAVKDPDRIELETDRDSYAPGEQLKLKIRTPFTGKALVTCEREKVISYQIVELKSTTEELVLPVSAAYVPNVYVSVQLIRPLSGGELTAGSAFGTIPVLVPAQDKRLNIQLNVSGDEDSGAAVLRPGETAIVDVQVANAAGPVQLTLAAVDEGICQITDYTAPSPFAFFHGKKRLSVDSYDMFDAILPEVLHVNNPSRAGGDAADSIRRRNLNPISVTRVKPVAWWSGVVTTDQEGKARLEFEVPDYNGTLRLMVVAFAGDRFGEADYLVPVRAPIIITPTLPRFLSSNDQFVIPIAVLNGTGSSGEFTLAVEASGPVQILGEVEQKLQMNSEEERQVRFIAKAAQGVGKAVFRITAYGNDVKVSTSVELPVRPVMPVVSRVQTGTITAGGPVEFERVQEFVPDTEEYELVISPFPSVQLGPGLQYLLRYPYGCLEQTTSAVFPLLYFAELVGMVGEGRSDVDLAATAQSARYFVEQGLAKLEAMQLSDGSFLYWPDGTKRSEWGSVYATHFLVEARKAGYHVSKRVYDSALSYLEELAAGTPTAKSDLAVRVYAMYVLALAGRPMTGTMLYSKTHLLDSLPEYSRAQLAAAFYLVGDRAAARELLPIQFSHQRIERETGGSFNSQVRNDAIILDTLVTVDPDHVMIPELVRRITAARNSDGYWASTQENAFALIALGKVLKMEQPAAFTGKVLTDSAVIAAFNHEEPLRIDAGQLEELWGDGSLRVEIAGDGKAYYLFSASGVPDTDAPTMQDFGLAVRREYLRSDGSVLSPDEIKQGDLVIAHLTLETPQDNLENIAVCDLLPAGLEVSNPRLGLEMSLAWMENQLVPDYADVRDDRVLVFASLPERGIYHFYYTLRAVTEGEFVLPPVKAESMYNPEIVSISGWGKVKVRQ